MQGEYRIIISPQASDDLNALYEYISEDSRDNAARMVDRILVSLKS
jgi:plasmid stabilization system protein ParE